MPEAPPSYNEGCPAADHATTGPMQPPGATPAIPRHPSSSPCAVPLLAAQKANPKIGTPPPGVKYDLPGNFSIFLS